MNEKPEVKMTREIILTLPERRKKGQTNGEIAKELGVHIGTIKFWFKRLKDKGYDIPKGIHRGGKLKVQL